MNYAFIKAQPIWANGREIEKNLTCGFKTMFTWDGQPGLTLSLACSNTYRFFINGAFIGAGPARGPHGYYRVDSWPLSPYLSKGQNILAIEVAVYNVNSFYLLDQPGFLQAEITSGDRVIAATDKLGDFTGGIVAQRIQKVQRYSFQRPFVECYRMDNTADAWRKNENQNLPSVLLCRTNAKNTITRNIPLLDFASIEPVRCLEIGQAQTGGQPEKVFKDRSLKEINEKLKGFPEAELEVHLSDEAQALQTRRLQAGASLPVALEANAYALFEFATNKTGLIGLQIHCAAPADVYLLFDELLRNNDVDFTRMDCCNVIKYALQAGDYDLLSFEPYTLKFLKVVVLGSTSTLQHVYLREYASSLPIRASYTSQNEKLQRIYAGAIETFRQNCVDIFMDCPSRERAGWLCDSFFTSRVEQILTGNPVVEHNFLENFLLPAGFRYLPEGMLPMCYPSDHYDGVFIPNWALWFVLELEEYLARSGDRQLINDLKPRVYHLFDYFKPFINEFGLLENLKSWIFVEWSKANDFVQDVNFPTNMLFAGALEAAGRLYQDDALQLQAARLRQTIRHLSFDGSFFIDNAVRKDQRLVATGEHTETCQYYAFFFDVAKPTTYARLWQTLTTNFGPQRKQTGAYPEIYPSNAFIGNYLRLEILTRYGYSAKVLDEIEGYFTYMVEKTGTLWEHDSDFASCNHGFASYVAYLLLKNS